MMNSRNEVNGWTPLIRACAGGRVQLAISLLTLPEVDVNVHGFKQETAFGLAYHMNYPSLVAALVVRPRARPQDRRAWLPCPTAGQDPRCSVDTPAWWLTAAFVHCD